MNLWIKHCCLCLLFSTPVWAEGVESTPTEPVRLIFDTDIGNDVDDVMALAVIHALENRGECELLAVTVSRDDPRSARFVDAVNTFYGRADIPIGIVHEGVKLETPNDFLRMVDQTAAGEHLYPHDLQETPAATAVLRQVLAKQTDHSVVIIQVGFSTNLSRLLASPSDQFSPLAGRDLVAKKVKLLSAMAGSFQPIDGNERFLEFNVVKDFSSAQQVATQWPTPIVFSGFEIGVALPYPAESIEQDFNYVAHHPVKDAYYNYLPPPHNRPTWDLTSVLWAIRPTRNYFGHSSLGRVTVEEDGFTRFVEDPTGTHRYLTIDEDQIAKTREALVYLVSEPPQSGRE